MIGTKEVMKLRAPEAEVKRVVVEIVGLLLYAPEVSQFNWVEDLEWRAELSGLAMESII